MTDIYSRSYYPESGEKLSIPENYDGTALLDTGAQQEEKTAEEAGLTAEYNTDSATEGSRESESVFSVLGRAPFLSGVFGKGGLFSGINLKLPKIGTEEILILATAAFLFFSKEGDRECAVMLLLLLLIN